MDMLLTVHQGKALAHFHQEGDEVVDDALLKVALRIGCVVFETEEFCYDGVLQIFQLILRRGGECMHFVVNGCFILRP